MHTGAQEIMELPVREMSRPIEVSWDMQQAAAVSGLSFHDHIVVALLYIRDCHRHTRYATM